MAWSDEGRGEVDSAAWRLTAGEVTTICVSVGMPYIVADSRLSGVQTNAHQTDAGKIGERQGFYRPRRMPTLIERFPQNRFGWK